MICYLDRGFCSAPCANAECYRNVTDEIRAGAAKHNLPLALSNFRRDGCGFTPSPSASFESGRADNIGEPCASAVRDVDTGVEGEPS